jgi:hypothetical protein
MWGSFNVSFQPVLILVQSVYSIFESPIYHIKKRKNLNKEVKTNKDNNILIGVMVLIIVSSFLLLYSKSNPVLSEYMSDIDLSFIEFGFIMKTFLIFFLLFGLIRFIPNNKIEKLNETPLEVKFNSIGEREDQDYKIGIVSIWIVSVLLVTMNALDVFVMFTGKLPKNVTYSEYVHQGFSILIFSMSLAVGLIIYFFRGQLNFYKKIDAIRKASSFWISQNLLLVIITGYKNYIYVAAYGLTYKRIAVFFGLFCVLVSLILSYEKVKRPISNWFYFNKLAFRTFLLVVVISVLPYDMIITNYNLKNVESPDYYYLLRLENPDLYEVKQSFDNSGFVSDKLMTRLEKRINSSKYEFKKMNWQSWNLYSKKNMELD